MISGTVYKLVDTRVPEEVLYVGSTETSLNQRWSTHKSDAKRYNSNVNTYLRDQGIDHFELVSLERGSFKDTAALREREEEYRVKLNPTLNSNTCSTGLAGLGLSKAEYKKQYNAENKDKINGQQKQYRAKNKEKVNDTERQYRAKNKERISAYQTEYKAENKERILKQRSERVTCDVCGTTTPRREKARHGRSKKHAAAVVAPFVRSRFARAAFLAKR
jgi:hypothetical protein